MLAYVKRIVTKKSDAVLFSDWLYLSVAVAVLAGLGLWNITASSIWFDESFSAYLIRFNFWEIAQYTAADVHPPLYYWFLKVWSLLFGTSDFALRSMSVFFAAIALIFAYLLLIKLFGRRAARLTLPLIVLSPFFIRYSQEMRMYTLVAAIGFAATYALVKAKESKSVKPWIVYGVLVSLGMWTHYFTALIWLSHWLWRYVEVRRSGLRGKKIRVAFFSKNWLYAHYVAVGLFLIWLPWLVRQVVDVQGNGFWIPPINPATIPDYLAAVFFYETATTTSPWLTVLLYLLMTIFVVAGIGIYKKVNKTEKSGMRLLVTMALLPVVLLLVTSLPPLQSSFIDRYLLVASIATVALFGVIISRMKSQALAAACYVALLVGMGIGIINVYHYGNYNRFTGQESGARQLLDKIHETNIEAPIIAENPWLYYDTSHYSSTSFPVYFVDERTEYRYGSLAMLKNESIGKINDFADFGKTHQFIWVVDRTNTSRPADTLNRSWQQVEVRVQNDPFTNKPAYHAVLYKTY